MLDTRLSIATPAFQHPRIIKSPPESLGTRLDLLLCDRETSDFFRIVATLQNKLTSRMPVRIILTRARPTNTVLVTCEEPMTKKLNLFMSGTITENNYVLIRK